MTTDTIKEYFNARITKSNFSKYANLINAKTNISDYKLIIEYLVSGYIDIDYANALINGTENISTKLNDIASFAASVSTFDSTHSNVISNYLKQQTPLNISKLDLTKTILASSIDGDYTSIDDFITNYNRLGLESTFKTIIGKTANDSIVTSTTENNVGVFYDYFIRNIIGSNQDVETYKLFNRLNSVSSFSDSYPVLFDNLVNFQVNSSNDSYLACKLFVSLFNSGKSIISIYNDIIDYYDINPTDDQRAKSYLLNFNMNILNICYACDSINLKNPASSILYLQTISTKLRNIINTEDDNLLIR